MARPYFGPKTPIAFAHRGGAKRRPENTLLAFEHAAELGYTHIETDIHETSDGHFVCFWRIDDGFVLTVAAREPAEAPTLIR